jgi:hypothetical protein
MRIRQFLAIGLMISFPYAYPERTVMGAVRFELCKVPVSLQPLLKLSLSRQPWAATSYPPNTEEAMLSVSDADARWSRIFIRCRQDYRSFHLLYLLKMKYPDYFNEIDESIKARVLVSAFRLSKFYNEWGNLVSDGEASEMLLQTGKNAIPLLVPLLSDATRVRLWGSEEATQSHLDDYRVCDYAYRFICALTDRESHIHLGSKPADRDPEIQNLRVVLSGPFAACSNWPAGILSGSRRFPARHFRHRQLLFPARAVMSEFTGLVRRRGRRSPIVEGELQIADGPT